MSMRAHALAAFGAFLVVAAACTDTTANPTSCAGTGAAASVSAVGTTSFSPAAVTVDSGQSVCWQNTTGVAHTVTSDDGVSFNSPLANHGNFIHVFSVKGTFTYHCSIHPAMTGTVTVN
jgi:plastocyanin